MCLCVGYLCCFWLVYIESGALAERQSTIYDYKNGWLRIGLSFCNINHLDVVYTLPVELVPIHTTYWSVLGSDDMPRLLSSQLPTQLAVWDLRTGASLFREVVLNWAALDEAQAFVVTRFRKSPYVCAHGAAQSNLIHFT